MSKSFTFDTTIERSDDEIDVRVTYEISPYIAQTHLQPAEGGTVEIVRAEFVNADAASLPAPLTDSEYDELQVCAEARAQTDMDEEAAEYAEYRYEQQRDQKMMDEWESRMND